MTWVKETLPPRARARWLLMTVRLSQSSLTGTERTEVAVGTLSDASMLRAVAAGMPRSTVKLGWSLASDVGCGLGSLATGESLVLGVSAAALSGRALATGLAPPEACAGADSAGCFFSGCFFSAGFCSLAGADSCLWVGRADFCSCFA